MRTIKFRGKMVDGGEWIYGYLSSHNTISVEVKDESVGYFTHEEYFIAPSTVGQFTGLHDKNGKEIYEGDILCNDKYQTWEWRGVVKFSHGVFGCEWLSNVKSQSMVGSWGQKHNLRKLDDDILERQIVIGNIYENPELVNN